MCHEHRLPKADFWIHCSLCSWGLWEHLSLNWVKKRQRGLYHSVNEDHSLNLLCRLSPVEGFSPSLDLLIGTSLPSQSLHCTWPAVCTCQLSLFSNDIAPAGIVYEAVSPLGWRGHCLATQSRIPLSSSPSLRPGPAVLLRKCLWNQSEDSPMCWGFTVCQACPGHFICVISFTPPQ